MPKRYCLNKPKSVEFTDPSKFKSPCVCAANEYNVLKALNKKITKTRMVKNLFFFIQKLPKFINLQFAIYYLLLYNQLNKSLASGL